MFVCSLSLGRVVLAGSLMVSNIMGSDIYVAPNGSDNNPGSRDLPFGTLERARSEVRALKAAGSLKKPGLTVWLRGGEYRLERTFELSPVDSGTHDAPIVWRAAEGETATLSGAREITGWTKVTEEISGVSPEAKGHLYSAEIPKGWRFHSFYVNGVGQSVSALPKGYWREWPQPLNLGTYGKDGLRLKIDTTLARKLPLNGDVELCMMPVQWWNLLPILRKVDDNSILIASRNPSYWPDMPEWENGNFSFRNALPLLTEAGEWCVDSTSGRVYYWPPNGSMEGAKTVAPLLYELIRLQGDDMDSQKRSWRVKHDKGGFPVKEGIIPDGGDFTQLVHHVEFRDLAFEHTDRMPEDQWPEYWLKRGGENPDAMVFLEGCEDIVIDSCTLRDAGAYAITLNHYARRVKITRNDIRSCGGGAILLSGYGIGQLDVNNHHVIRRNYIRDLGLAYMHSGGISIIGSNTNEIALNWLSNLPYGGILIFGAAPQEIRQASDHNYGYRDTYGHRFAAYQAREDELPEAEGTIPPYSREVGLGEYERGKSYLHDGNNFIQRNVVENFMTTLGDGGALYSWGNDHGTVWWENLLKKGKGLSVYIDDFSGRTIVYGTIAWASGDWLDNTHTPSPPARSREHQAQNTIPDGWFNGPTVNFWRDNIVQWPQKPAGFDERLDVIAHQAHEDGGWPATLTPEVVQALKAAPSHP